MVMIKIIMNINSIWVSTTPRTGSMWVYNVTREILKLSKINVLPVKYQKVAKSFLKYSKNKVLLIKMTQINMFLKFIRF